MEPIAWKLGLTFLKETSLPDSVQPVTPERESKTCGVCEPNEKIIHLPKPAETAFDQMSLFDTIENRRSVRTYSDDTIMQWELSLMLHYTQGISSEKTPHLRYVPSAGAVHPFETYIVINRVEGLENGIYRYLPLDHALVLERCHVGNSESIAAACRRPELVRSAAITFLWIAVPDRILWKFGPRGWRYLFIEAGHLCQNLYLVATALKCGACAIGSYRDDEMNCALGIDGVEQFCIYMASVGKRIE